MMPRCATSPPKLKPDHGRCEILVNNAAISADTHIETMTMEDYHRVIRINQDGAVRMSMAFVPLHQEG